MTEEISAGAVILAIIGLVIWLAIRSDNEWEAFKVQHNCHVVAHISGSYAYNFGKGGGTVYVPSKDGWLCNDSVTYYR